jgi:uncharacterized membrane protein
MRPLAPLLLSGLFSAALVLARVTYTDRVTYVFLLWNLFLAGLPVLLAHAAVWWQNRRGTGTGLAVLVLAWLLFFPNAPYIVTDFLHLKPRGPVPLWYDCVLLFSFAWNGALFGFYSLRMMHDLAHRLAGPLRGWLFVLAVCVLSGLGVYLGRFERWNSWDIVHRPVPLIQSAVSRVLDDHPRTAGIILVFSAFLLSGYGVYYSAGVPLQATAGRRKRA